MTTTTQQPSSPIEPQTIPCPSWCVSQDAEDEACMSGQQLVILSLYPRQRWTDGTWTPEYAEVTGFYDRAEDQVRVDLDIGGAAGMRFTLAEARQVAAALVAVADEMEAGK